MPLALPESLFSVVAARANGARTLVRRKVGWRRGLEVTQRESAVPAFLRDKSRAPGPFLVGALNTYGTSRPRPCSLTFLNAPCAEARGRVKWLPGTGLCYNLRA